MKVFVGDPWDTNVKILVQGRTEGFTCKCNGR